MTWKRGTNSKGQPDDYYITNGKANICKVTVSGVLWYELWIAGKYVDRFKTADEAKGKA